ncbi:Transcriptional regulatory protein ZraR [Planctomycetes bacterium Poly30]|uniref:Transcriptional regulatory protein ZraR n=1 Tax=Saltatorellus ferox TaxID=2528018 RepID=A0A518ENK7_9BACT|nr:Transcriptional regulatory protein ZraR [Planctomycetes bacterium Poly30]
MVDTRHLSTEADQLGLQSDAVEALGEGAFGPVLRLRRAGGDLVLRWLDRAESLLPLVGILGRSRHAALVLPSRMGLDLRGRAWVARPYCEGATLEEHRPPAEDPRWPDLVRQWLEALDALHAGDWLQRDVKASNLLVGPEGAKLFDLDLAAEVTSGGGFGSSAGTRRWLAPEVLAGEPAEARSDLFALGVAVARALLGNGSEHFTETFPSRDFWTASRLDPTALPVSLRGLVQALVERDPAARPASAMAAIALLPGGQPVDGTLAPPPLLGRAEALMERARVSSGRGESFVLITEDPSDQEDVLPVLGAAAALEGRSFALIEHASEERDLLLAGSTSVEPEVRGLFVRLEGSADGAILAEALVEASAGRTGPVIAVVTREQARAVELALGSEGVDGVVWHSLEGVPLEGLTGHLASQAALSAHGVIEALALDLHARSGGRQSVLEAALARAVPLGVAQHLTDGWVLQRDRWPEDLPADLPLDPTPGPIDRRAPARAQEPEAVPFESVEALRREGRLAAARSHADRFEQAHAPLASEMAVRLGLLRARLELAEGAFEAAALRLSTLEASTGDAPEGALHGVRLLRADAAQRLGDHALALTIYSDLEAHAVDADVLLGARVGAAHLDLLSGAFETVLEKLQGEASVEASAEVRGAMHNLRGGALVRLGRGDDARAEFDDALALGLASGDPGLAARALLNRAVVDRGLGRFAEAEASLEEADALVRPTDLLGVRALVTHNLGTLLRDRGDLRRARLSLERALRLRRRAGDEYGIATTFGSLALLDLEQGVLGRASVHLAEAEALLAAGGHGAERAVIEVHREMVAAALGDASSGGAENDAEDDAPVRSLAEARLRALRAHAHGTHSAGSRSFGGAKLAREALGAALSDATVSGGVAERFRCVSLAHALEPRGPRREELAEELRELATVLGPARVREARFRTADAPALGELSEFCEGFEREGRIDLEWGASRVLAATARGPEVASVRRRAARRAEQLGVQIGESIPDGLRDAAMGRILEWTGRSAAAAEPPRAVQLDVEWFSSVNRELAASENLDELLAMVLDQALECTGARRGLMLLRQPDGLEVLSTRQLGAHAASDGDLQLSSSLVRSAMETGHVILTQDIASDPRFREAASVQSLELRAILCVPIMGASGAFGALYVDDDRPQSLFDETDSRALTVLAEQAGAVARQLIALKEIRALNARLEERVASQKEELVAVRTQLRRSGSSPAIGGLVGESPAIHALRDQIRRLAKTDLPVLITGPSGSGKELVARALHSLGPRDSGPLVIENMAAFSESLMESELFGHARGAFTGANGARVGLFEEADGGTLFLDEIADLQASLQAKLLRVLESGEFRRVGESSVRHANVRLVAATNADMSSRVAAGQFRQDLYYRLNAAEVRLPSLRERSEDIPHLVDYFLTLLREAYSVEKPMSARVLRALTERAWPGEVRELRNEVERLFLLSGDTIDDPEIVRDPMEAPAGAETAPASYTLADAERRAIMRALEAASGNRAEAARLLEVSRAGFYNKLRRFDLE